MSNQLTNATISDAGIKKLRDARQSFAKWNDERIRKQRENPIDWPATVKAGYPVYQTK